MAKGLTDRAKRIIGLASAEALNRGGEVDTVDVLVGMLHEGTGIAAFVLKDQSIESDLIVRARESVSEAHDIAFTDLESRSLLEADWFDHGYGGTEHLLLALCCFSKAKGTRLLRKLRKDPTRICSRILEILGYGDEWERWLADHRDAVLDS